MFIDTYGDTKRYTRYAHPLNADGIKRIFMTKAMEWRENYLDK